MRIFLYSNPWGIAIVVGMVPAAAALSGAAVSVIAGAGMDARHDLLNTLLDSQ